jgi:cytochrome c oxidase assembly factor CtaG
MTGWHALAAAWSWEPSVIAACALAAGGYVGLAGGRVTGRGWWFLAGVAVLYLALASPLDLLGDRYLFSAHMLQHMLLVLVVPPLLLLGLPERWVRLLLQHPAPRGAERVLRRPVAAWAAGMGTVALWHSPALYNAALASQPVHVLQHLSFLASSVIFWWPVCAPLPESRLPPLGAVLYLLAAALVSSGLGIILTVTPPGLYPAYLHPADPLGILPLVRATWGLGPAQDQELGGLLMWVPGGLVYLAAILATLGRWWREDGTSADGFASAKGRTETALEGDLHGIS